MRTPDAAGPMAVTVEVLDPGMSTSDAVTGSASSDASAGPFTARTTRVGVAATRRLVGALVLVLIAAVLIAVNHRPADLVAGQPVAGWPQPPAVGSCLDLAGRDQRVVPCDGPHDAEVTRSVDARDPMATAMSQDRVYDACGEAADRYVGLPFGPTSASIPQAADGQTDWQAPLPVYSGKPVYAPPDQRAGRYGWVACVILPQVPTRYTGSVKGMVRTAAAEGEVGSVGASIAMPAAYRTCVGRNQRPASCAGPHQVEVVASGWAVTTIALNGSPTGDAGATDPPSPAEIQQRAAASAATQRIAALRAGQQQQCEDLASAVVGTEDPTFGGKLLVRIDAAVDPGTSAALSNSGGVQQVQPGQVLRAGSDMAVSYVSGVSCVIRSAHGEALTASMVGWGDRPPPLAEN